MTMNHQLLYEIAGHRMSIITPDTLVTESLIPSFHPFKVSKDEKSNFLFQLSGNRDIIIPDREPDDTMEVDGLLFQVYHNGDSVTVSVINSDKKHSFNISANKKRVTTDLTLFKEYESHFLAYFLRAAYGIAAANHQTIKLHASVIVKEGKALIFMGKTELAKGPIVETG